MAKAELLAGSTYLVRGSPSTLIYTDGPTAYIVDPGHGSKRHKELRSALRRLGASRARVLVTHYHSDHHGILASGKLEVEEVAAPPGDAPLIRDPRLRVIATFGYPLSPESELLTFGAPATRVDSEVTGYWGPLKLLELPGHTLGQVGVETPDGVLYVADALFGPRVLERYSAPYHVDPCLALETLQSLSERLGDYRLVVPGHGPMEPGSRAVETTRVNADSVGGLLKLIASLAEEGTTPARVLKRLPPSGDAGLALLVEQTIRGGIACLEARGILKAEYTEGEVVWYKRGELAL